MSDNILSKIHGEILGSAGYELPGAASSPEASLRVRVRLPDGTRADVVFVKLSSKKGRSNALVLDAGQRGDRGNLALWIDG